MIGYIKGKVLSYSNGTALIENNGIGYEVTCSASVYSKITSAGQGEVYTYMAVKEDGVFLYGFSSLEEKEMFLKLISVSGVGPKMGITVLSSMNIKDLAIKIATSDVKGLSSVKGLGKKTAERIIVELREKFALTDTETGEVTVLEPNDKTEEQNKDAIMALMSLGLTKAESIKGVKEAISLGAKNVFEIVTLALKNLK